MPRALRGLQLRAAPARGREPGVRKGVAKFKPRLPVVKKKKITKQELKEAKAQSRQARALTAPPGSDLSELELRTVGKEARAAYEAHEAEFSTWAVHNKLGSLKLPQALDRALTAYINHELFFRGESVHVARQTLYGVIYVRGLPKDKTTLPRARRALAGFSREEPPQSEDPAPIEALALIADHLISQDSLSAKLAATALVCSFDLFTRPSETLELRHEDIIPPRGRYKSTSVIVAPLPIKASTLKAATAPAPKSAKSGEFDDTVLAGLPGLGLEWVESLMVKLKEAAVAQQRLFDPLNLAEYEALLRDTSTDIKLSELHITPHSMRHGGASLASYNKILDADGIRKQGRWNAEKSARRYEKKGRLTRQVAKMSAKQVQKGADLLRDNNLRNKIFDFVKTLAKQRWRLAKR